MTLCKIYFTFGPSICKIHFTSGTFFKLSCLTEITDTERGVLWEHLVLDMLKVEYGEVFYWRDKNKNEVDFVIKGKDNGFIAIECKINPLKFSPKSIKEFRKLYPDGKNYCFLPQIHTGYKLNFDNLIVNFVSTVEQIINLK